MNRSAKVSLIAIVILALNGLVSAQKPLVDANAKDERLFALEDLRPGKMYVTDVFSDGAAGVGVDPWSIAGFQGPRHQRYRPLEWRKH